MSIKYLIKIINLGGQKLPCRKEWVEIRRTSARRIVFFVFFRSALHLTARTSASVNLHALTGSTTTRITTAGRDRAWACIQNKPKMVNAPEEGLNQAILRKVQRFLTEKFAKTFASTHYKLHFINANNFH